MSKDFTDLNDSIPLGYSASCFGDAEENETFRRDSESEISRKSTKTSELLKYFRFNGTPSSICVHPRTFLEKSPLENNESLSTKRRNVLIEKNGENTEGKTINNDFTKQKTSNERYSSKTKKKLSSIQNGRKAMLPVENGNSHLQILHENEHDEISDPTRNNDKENDLQCSLFESDKNDVLFESKGQGCSVSGHSIGQKSVIGGDLCAEKTPQRTPVVLHFSSNKDKTMKCLAVDEIISAKTPKGKRKMIKSGQKYKKATTSLCPVDELSTCFDKDSPPLSSIKSTSKYKPSDRDKSNITSSADMVTKEISQWSVTFSRNQVHVEGYSKEENNKQVLFRTSFIVDVKNGGRTIVTSGGSVYNLSGNMLVQASVNAGVPLNTANKFVKGFPSGWRTFGKRHVNLNSSDSGSYQGQTFAASDEINHSHEISQSTRRTRASENSDRPFHMSLDETNNNHSHRTKTSDPSDIFLLSTLPKSSFSPAKPDVGKYASALTPVTENSFHEQPADIPNADCSATIVSAKTVSQKKNVDRGRSRRTIHTTSTSPLQQETEAKSLSKTCRKKKTSSNHFYYPDVCEIETTKTPKAPSNKKLSVKSNQKSTLIKRRTKLPSKNCLPIEEDENAPALIHEKHKHKPSKSTKRHKQRRKSAKNLYNTPVVKSAELSTTKQENSVIVAGDREDGNRNIVNVCNEMEESKKNITAEFFVVDDNSSGITKSKSSVKEIDQENTGKPTASIDLSSETLQISSTRRRKILDRERISSTRVRTRSYKVPITPLVVSDVCRLSNHSKIGCDRDIPALEANVHIQVIKTKSMKRERENGDIARPKKRSKKSTTSDTEDNEVELVTSTEKVSKNNSKIKKQAEDKSSKKITTKVEKAVRKPLQEKKWTAYQHRKLRKLVNEGLNWEDVSNKMGFSAEECEKAYNERLSSMKRTKKVKVHSSAGEKKGPVEITARPGTLKHRKQVHEALEVLKKPRPEYQDFFSADVGQDEDNIFSSNMFKASEQNYFVPLTPNMRAAVSMDATLATPAWFKTPTSSNNHCNWSPMTDAQTPAELKQIFSPEPDVFVDKDKQRKEADRVIVQMKKKMMRGTLIEYDNAKKQNKDPKKKSDQQADWNSNLDLETLKKFQNQQNDNNNNDDDDSDKDEYFDCD
ncbi:uncharacterized protein LOC120335612 [Styela clava]